MFAAVWLSDATDTFLDLQARASRQLARRAGRGKASKDEGLFKQLVKTVDLLLANPRHPGLNTHEFHGMAHPYDTDGKVFEAYVQNRTPGAYRLFWCYGPGKREITILAITPHP